MRCTPTTRCESEGVAEGSIVRLGPGRTPVKVIGFLDDSRYSGQGTLWGSLDTWRTALAANRPGARVDDGVVQALVVARRAASAEAEAIDRATGGATSTLTIGQAIDALPGVSQQQTVFNQIIAVTVVIALVVVALFFALITVERTALYGVLKAVGASSRTLFAGVLVQALVVTAIASAIGGVRLPPARRGHPRRLDPLRRRPRPPAQQRRLPGRRRRHRLRLLPAARPEDRPRLRHRRAQ